MSKLGTGTLILGANNTYAGGTTIAAGTQLGSGAGGSTAGSILGNVSNSGTLAFNRSNTYTYGGIISGAGNVEQMGSGTTVLTGNSNYTGGTLISAGALQLGAGGATGSISGNVTNNGALVFNRGDTYTFGGLISGTGSVTQQGSGTTVLTGNNYTGGTTISAGTLQLGAGGTTGSIVGDVANNGALVFNRADAYTFGGLISGGGAVTQAGAGTTVLTADNTYAGGTTISAGTLQLGNGGGQRRPARSRTPARWSWTATHVVLAGPIRGSGKLVQQGVGDTFLTGDNTYSGGTVISAGTLRLGAGGTTGSVTGDILNNSRLVIERSNEVLMTGLISGTGQLVQEGAGQTVLSGNNAYAGPTLVNFGSLYINGDQTAATGRHSCCRPPRWAAPAS